MQIHAAVALAIGLLASATGRAAAAEAPSVPASFPPAPPTPLPRQEPPPRAGLHGLPYAGVQDFFGKGTEGLGLGVRVGVLFGYRLDELFSANGEISVDFLNADGTSSRSSDGRDFGGSSRTRSAMTTFALSPLFHLVGPRVELAAGPKLGVWRGGTGDDQGGLSSVGGYVIGANAGLFVRVRREVALGAFLSFADLTFSECSFCTESPDVDPIQVFGFTFAALL
jgi:hypothetical protein